MRIIFLSMCGLIFLAGEVTYATSCRSEPVPVEERAKSADVIFVGRYRHHLEKVDSKNSPYGATLAAVLSAKKVFKGKLGKEVTVYFKPEHIGCSGDYYNGFQYDISRNSDVLFFAKSQNGSIYISAKLGARVANKYNKDLKYLSDLK